jgi:alpha-tubulin suppressor-like RCC1 family protein
MHRHLSHLPSIRLLALGALALPACASSTPAGGDDGRTAQTAEALTTCITLQRGTLGAVQDTTITSSVTTPGWNGTSTTIHAGGTYESLLKFDVTPVPAGAVVTSSTLSLTTTTTVSNAFLFARLALGTWSETTSTWAAFNQQTGANIGSMTPSSVNTTQTMSLNPLAVQRWRDGTLANNGIVLETMISNFPNAYKDTYFVSSDSPTVALRPSLQVCYTPVDYCAPAPCLNGATCTSGGTTYTCACAPGFTGTNCQTNIDDCAGSPCQHGGSCTDGVNSYTCACAPGYTGAQCQTDINECAPAPCQNGAVCTDQVNAYACTCLPGFTGTDCQINIDDCAGSPCQNGGACTDGVNSFTCACAAGFSGSHCQTNIDDCVGNACQNGSTCVDGIASYACACAPGFTGAQCQTNIDDCTGSPCQNGGTCSDGVNSYTCACAPGFTGANCTVDIDDCAGNPCQNGGTCVDGVNSYACQCPAAFSGTNCQNASASCSDCTQNQDETGVDCGGSSCAPCVVVRRGIAAGSDSSCAILPDGTAECWGYNSYGTLGDGSTTSSLTPVTVSGLSSAVGIDVGYLHACALLGSGAVQCWGYNHYGQLGNGGGGQATTPQDVLGISTAVAISAGDYQTCAVLSGGAVQCWGYNGYGELGNGTYTDAATPTPVSGITNAVAVSAGNDTTCAVLAGGLVQCWGYNGYGQVGDGTDNDSPTPVTVVGIHSAVSVALGDYHGCALLSSGQVMCWGYNGYGELGDGTFNDSLTPVMVSGVCSAVAIVAGSEHTCALLSTGTVTCWGYGYDGELGDGTSSYSPTPGMVSGISGAVGLAGGDYHNCAMLGDGSVQCWGYGHYGQLGQGTRASSGVPVSVNLNIVNYCAPSPCQNGGACANGATGYTCTCPGNFGGTNCEIDECAPNPCQNGGTCSGNASGHTCACLPGFVGTDCEQPVIPMDFGGMYGFVEGVPQPNPATGASSCPAGYTTTAFLGTPGSDYDAYYCWRGAVAGQDPIYDFGGMWGYINNQLAVNSLTGGASCPSGYTDLQVAGASGADYPLHVCYQPHVGGTTVPRLGGMFGVVNGAPTSNVATGAASCPAGYTQVQALGTPGIDSPVYYCFQSCPVGFVGNNCDIPVVPMDFGGMYGYVEGAPQPNPATGASSCPPGYTATALLDNPGFDYPVYYCWRGHVAGQETLYDFGGMWGYVAAQPVNNPATGASSCPAGYTDMRVSGTSGSDYELHVCYQPHQAGTTAPLLGGMFGAVGGYPSHNPATGAASCPAGYTAAQVLGTQGIDSPVYYCYQVCPAGFAGALCEVSLACANSPCQHGGTCSASGATYACQCTAAWTGANCTVDVDECASADLCTAAAGGTCTNTPGGYECSCPVVGSNANCGACTTSPPPACINEGDLSNVGSGDFRIQLTLTTTQVGYSYPEFQRATCGNGMFWDLVIQNGLVAVETDDGTPGHYTGFFGTSVINDGQPHVVVVERKAGQLYLTIDCVMEASAPSPAVFAQLPPLTFGGLCSVTDFQGTLAGGCLARTP